MVVFKGWGLFLPFIFVILPWVGLPVSPLEGVRHQGETNQTGQMLDGPASHF